MKVYDFSGYATKNDLRCSDGRVIRQDAFKDNDGTQVPLVWQHQHDAPTNVLGHALLENKPDGVYAYCTFNSTEQAQHAKVLVEHGDVNSLSIYANQLKQRGSDVLHGVIREVSLVLAGANPGATIENVSMAHADGTVIENREEAVIFMDQPLRYLSHAVKAKKEDDEEIEEPEDEEVEESEDEEVEEKSEKKAQSKKNQNGSKKSSDNETIEDVLNTLNNEQAALFKAVLEEVQKQASGTVKHAADSEDDETEETSEIDTEEVYNSLNDKQKTVLYFLVQKVLDKNNSKKASKEDADEDDQNDESEETTVKHNVFDSIDETSNEHILSHDEMTSIMTDARSNRASLKDTFLQHGIENIDVLFPEARNVTPTPEIISRQMEWVSKVWNGVKKSPFSRIKSVAANLTFEDARAKGYLKYPDDHDQDGSEYPGDGIVRKKLMEKFPLLSRVTIPQTIYKLQKLHRDDIVDITDLDVVSWLKTEMRTMLDEELSRAILIGDGRDASAEDKIRTENIRPIYGDDDVYTIYYTVDFSEATDATEISNTLIDAANYARKDYMGSGNPVFFASPLVVTYLLLAKDKLGRRLYPTLAELASALRVSAVVEVPAFEDQTRTDSDDNEMDLLGLIVDLSDYTVGADKMGSVNMFDDFDIDYNMYTYMIETRCSGALTKPYSAIALEASSSASTSLRIDG